MASCGGPGGDVEQLRRENAQLRGQVADLAGALKARDLEIAALRGRCQALLKSIEQQDETIAKIYAVAEPPANKHGATSSSGHKPAATGVLSEAIDRILHPPSKAVSPTPPRHRRMSLFDDDSSSSTTDDTSPSSCSSALSKSSSGRNFERRESCASEEDFVKSAGFLRKPSRRSSGRLSVSDFGLLDTETEETENEGNQHEVLDTEVSRKDAARPTSERFDNHPTHRVRSSQRNLFADIDETVRPPKKTNKLRSNQDEEDEHHEMTYAEFLEQLRLPGSRDILETIRTFLASILGPRGDGKPPRSTDFVDYDFYGTHEFRRRCIYFFQSTEELLQNHPVWCRSSEITLSRARDSIEKYVMDQLQDIAMNQLDECAMWKKEDDRLMQRMKLLSFITPDMLDIKSCMRNEVVWSMAEDELRRINSFRCPGDKINCIVRCCTIIFSVLNLSRGDSGSRPGADDFLPVFIYIVLHSKIPRLHSNCEYIATYRNPNDLMSKAGYCFVNLRSAIEFLNVADASMLSVSEEEFNRLIFREECKLRSET